MAITLAVFGILGAVLIGAISPGPSFVFVARTSIAMSRRHGLAAALGMGVGGAFYGGLVLFGLHIVLTQVEWLYLGLKVLGGLYLLYLAIRLWRGADDPIVVAATSEKPVAGLGRSFVVGLSTQLANPKTAVYYGSVLTALLPPEAPTLIVAVVLPLILVIEAGWYTIVALAFSSNRPRGAYLRSKTWIDRAAGSVMGLLGVKLIDEARQAG